MIYGVPILTSENISVLVSGICVKLGIEPSNVISAFRIPAGKSRLRPIIVKFSSMSCKQFMLRKYLMFKNLMLSDIDFKLDDLSLDRLIYINECLTKDDNIIFKRANDLPKDGKLFKVSTRNGYVVVKRTALDDFQRCLMADLETLR